MVQADVLVLGAGIVGVSTALHLQARGRKVVLADRHANAGQETSFGNAGLIERSSVVPYMFPRELLAIVQVAAGRSAEARYHLNSLAQVMPWLLRYFAASSVNGTAHSAAAALPLIERSVLEHDALMLAAKAEHLARRSGWIKLYHSPKALAKAAREAEGLRLQGHSIMVHDSAQLAAIEPHLAKAAGAVHFLDPVAVSDPGALSLAYAALFKSRGGQMAQADALGLQQTYAGWSLASQQGDWQAREAVVALGPWASHLLRPLGYRIPLGIKRGYHMHYGAKGNAVLNHPVLDAERGFLLAPMTRGIRLTTGAEFARFDAPPTPVQVDRAEPKARRLFPLAERLDATAWMGRRPCLPDMLPVIGAAPRHQGLWLNFGHQHHGLTLGPATGRLLAEIMTGAVPFTDPKPYSLARFG